MTKMFFKAGLGLLAAACLLPASVSAVEYPAMPAITVAPGLRGQAAIAALGSNLAAVAAHYGKTTNELVALFNRDSAVRLDRHANLYYVCDNTPPANGSAITNHPAAHLFPFSQTFLLHSKPGSTKTIFLDFDGYTISGTAWNDTYNGGADIVAPPWDLDGNPGSFSTNEQAIIQEVWLRVAEDYAPFDVDVTTQDPGDAAMTRADLSDQVFGTRALISPISSQIVSAGGVAYLGVFNEVGNYHKPALVFPENLLNDEKDIGEAASHEVGHNLSLTHQGTTTGLAYFLGHGNWAPIMGAGYYVSVSQWAKGEYLNANNQEDELANITATGLNYRAADFGTNILTATPLNGVNNFTNGIITRTDEKDFFSFQTGAGTAFINVLNWERGSDLHLILGVYDNSGTIITNVESVDNAVSGTRGVTLALPVVNGKYYISINGKDAGNPLTNGYSSYGSLGQYSLSLTNPFGTGTVISAPAPPWGNTLSVMNGSNPNGLWFLFIQDDRPVDTGGITNGWSVALTSANPVGYASDNQVFGSPSNSVVALGANWNVTMSVTNYGPSYSTNVVVTDILPDGAGILLLSNTPSIGSVIRIGSTMTWNVGNLTTNAGATLKLTFATSATGSYSNAVFVTSATPDPNPDDDVAVASVTVINATPPVISGPLLGTGGKFIFSVSGSGGPTVIQASTNLVNWANVYTNTPPFTYTNDITSFPYRFYRAVTGL